MKKRMITAVIMAALTAAMLLSGCTSSSEPDPTPAPQTTVSPITSPDMNGSSTNGDVSGSNGADSNGSVNGSQNNGGTGSGSSNGTVGQAIENFVEGMTVELATLPEDIRNAIKKEYPDVTVKTVTYTTYENQQMYKVTTESGEDKATEEFYVTADGKIVPVDASGSGANGSGSSNGSSSGSGSSN